MPHIRSSHSSSPSSRAPRRQIDRAPHRPERYELEHRPRRVIPAHRDEPQDEEEYSREGETEQSEARPVRRPAPLGKRLRRLGLGPWEWIGLSVSCVICAFLLPEIFTAQGDHQMLRTQVQHKEQQLAALEKQKREDQKKLAYLKSEKGREQILAERGYLKPGDRILLFPADDPAGEPAE